MMILKKHLHRRTFLRGVGATIALPLLDSMVPALSAVAKTAGKPVNRLGIMYLPNGALMQDWTPTAEGAGFEMTPILSPIEAYRDRMLVLSGLGCAQADSLGDGSGDHSRASAAFLTGVHPKKTEGAVQAGISFDQIAAREFSRETQLASLELAADSLELLGTCDTGYSCAYSNTVSWRSPTSPMPLEADPRAVFERLFGASDTTDARARLANIREERSILDAVTSKVTGLRQRLGPGDRTKLTDYLDAIRDVERRIQRAEEQSGQEFPVVDRPVGIPSTFEEHIKLMFDMQVLAYQCDLTRVVTLMLSREASERSYPESGVTEGHHPLSHHGGNPEKMSKVGKINTYHVKVFGYLLEKLRATEDGDGNLLDHSMLVYGSGISDGNTHYHLDLPLLLMGGGAGQLKGGRHLRYPKGTPVTNLYVSLLDKLGIAPERLGDSTGKLDLDTLSGV
jgi:hypothetical protein